MAEGPSVGPYFCLSDLAKHWPSNDSHARREVLLITNGVEPYNPHYDPDNVYVQSASEDSVRAGLVVYSIYWSNFGNSTNTTGLDDSGQNYLNNVTQATGGNSYWIGNGNPVSLQPYFEDIERRLENQYELVVSAHQEAKQAIQTLKLKLNGGAVNVSAPEKLLVNPAGAAQ
jgi:hypothetical protein